MLQRTIITGFFFFLSLFTISACDTNEPDEQQVDIPQPRTFSDTDFTTTGSGLKYFDFVTGSGPVADVGDRVDVHYTGWLTNGALFDSSVFFNRSPFPVIIGQTSVIQGWTEGLQGMQLGGQRQLVIPPGLAYGPSGSRTIPPNATLIFEVEVINLVAGQ